jgi:peptidyl-tRNA hydrolase, PTH1 family
LKLIAGLGNPGPKYDATRHNLGFMVIDAAAARFRLDMGGKAHRAQVGRGRIAGVEVLLAKPQTFMNLSGDSVGPLMRDDGLGPADVVVVHDDLDLPLGVLKVSVSGGDGGHNGVASVIEALGTGSFVRLRVGIGRPPDGVDPVEFVLSGFSAEEAGNVEKVISAAVEAVASIVREGPSKAMNRFNKRPVTADDDGKIKGPETGAGQN